MKKVYLSLAAMLALASTTVAQVSFDPQVDFDKVEVPNWLPTEVVMPASPLKMQILFIGGEHMVQTTETYGNAAGETPAKEWHDFIGFTEDTESDDLGWVSVNHEMVYADDKIGDGGGMTVFKVKRDADTDSLIVVEQTLADGRQGQFFNVDFVNTVGETGMNCGGIVGPTGRIWTAEEWFRSNNKSISDSGRGVRDTTDWTISSDIAGDFDGATIQRYQNFNYMVEIDPREAVAVRKQYNWGRMPYEGGVILPDNKTVFLGADATPGYFMKFVAEIEGDFTQGKLYAYKHDAATKWVEIDNSKLDNILSCSEVATEAGATMYNRLEWGTYNDGMVYWTETGRNNPSSRWNGEAEAGAVYAPHHIARAEAQGVTADDAAYADYYGRVLAFDLATEEMSVFLESGFGTKEVNGETKSFAYGSEPNVYDYPNNMLSNPDGLTVMTVNPGTEAEHTYMVIQEDLNGSSYGRMPRGARDNRTCEAWLLDLAIENPTIDDLARITAVPLGAEITGARATSDGKSLLINSQHPRSSNTFPYNHSLTFALTGWSDIAVSNANIINREDAFSVYPNPVSRTIFFDKVTDVAIYTIEGKRVKVARNTKSVNVQDLTAGTYVIMNQEGQTKKFIVQ